MTNHNAGKTWRKKNLFNSPVHICSNVESFSFFANQLLLHIAAVIHLLCSMDIDMMQPVQQVLMPSLNASSSPETLHVLSGSFRSLSLFLLAFSPVKRTLSLVQQVPGFGPHQYVSTNRDMLRTNGKSDGLVVYTTSWAIPPILSSWEITPEWHMNHLNNVPITAVSSYIALPPPYTHLYSMGGPTGESHLLSPGTGSFAEKIQEVLFIPAEKLVDADKSRKALRYGSHAIEFTHIPGTNTRLAFVPVLGTSSIEVYTHNPVTGILTHIYSSPSPRIDVEDGPRHVKIHPNRKMLYCVTEHNNLIDVYSISGDLNATEWSTNPLTHLATRSLLPSQLSYPSASMTTVHQFRGDTLMLGPGVGGQWPTEIWATTRGATEDVRGWVSVFKLDQDGMFTPSISIDDSAGSEDGVERYETLTSGGKAHAIDLYLKSSSHISPSVTSHSTHAGSPVWILLTDDSDYAAGEVRDEYVSQGFPLNSKEIQAIGGVRVLEWDGWSTGGVQEVVGYPPLEIPEGEPRKGDQGGGIGNEHGDVMRGGSHAVWLTID
ncbi:hypothetical protein J3R30DRAFT_3462755 [Lentinula aciculospora]|uniref:3-carboxy-cis,cis-mucoante lactonizing enzyme n=1 Tax=Lentinula aciculospora TaxID=153920 RepID=A0A9W9AFR4_9AGAR|nr:hypothetical protein J3R30DRAFT_3462755 [Lentinula aciculospora]